MSEQEKTPELLKKRRKIWFCVIGGVVALALLLVQLAGELPALFPTQEAVRELERELKKLEKQEAELLVQAEAAAKVRFQADSRIQAAWNIAAMGDPEVELRAKIQEAAKTLELKPANISTVRRTKFNDDLSTLEVDLTLSSDIDSLVKFFAAIEKIEPPLYWRRFEFRSEGAGSVNFSGSLRCFCDERTVTGKKSEAPEKGLESAPDAPVSEEVKP